MNLLRDWLVDPLSLLFLLSLLLLAPTLWQRSSHRQRRRHRHRSSNSVRGWLLRLVWFGSFFLISAPVVVNPMVALLEDRFPLEPVCELNSPIVLLGGGLDSRIEDEAEFERMSKATMTRTAEVLRLSEKHPLATIIVSGGALQTIAEADVMVSFLQRMGVQNDRILHDRLSMNTADNASAIVGLLRNHDLGTRVQLVTSALHMTRAVAVFEKQGIDVCAVPVDNLALKELPIYTIVPQSTALVKFDKLLHELVAWVVYRVKGHL